VVTFGSDAHDLRGQPALQVVAGRAPDRGAFQVRQPKARRPGNLHFVGIEPPATTRLKVIEKRRRAFYWGKCRCFRAGKAPQAEECPQAPLLCLNCFIAGTSAGVNGRAHGNRVSATARCAPTQDLARPLSYGRSFMATSRPSSSPRP
jgi:hypothetical protein